MLRLSDFDYRLPKELIAQYPPEARDEARLLIVERKTGALTHARFRDITAYFKAGDLLVLNDTRVLSCRLKGKRASGGKVEVMLLGRKEGMVFSCLLKPAGRLKKGEKIVFNGGSVFGEVKAKDEIVFNTSDAESIYRLGVMPLPPYIKREAEERDNVYYQTVYAKNDGAVASPTAGLHFTENLLQKISLQRVSIAFLTLHVGVGTFKPVKHEVITAHKMEPEYFEISDYAADRIDKAKKEKSRIIAVGTTSLRALETYAGGIKKGYTDLFIYPGYDFKLAGSLLTNFHLPKTTLFMLVCAFLGEKLAKEAYLEAVENKYRFYSYGDAMLIL
ncbi:MAG: tRNA preQ1(34) S-adenosylmethionine ribosyltransferase-isomerase QueA [Candidatus Omnitrophica bacterium]|nr:tRNA preQ1(34) S-adenosylmethionine ribosyltransferase-isomerase QueA [Candidatus Omnitrophota bacterium]